MSVVKSLEDLERIREQAKEMIDYRVGNENKTRVVVGMGTCGIAAGARTVMMAMLDELKKRNVHDVIVTETGCAGLCQYEPQVDVIKPGEPKVTYVNVKPESAREIVVKHLINNQVVSDLVVPNI